MSVPLYMPSNSEGIFIEASIPLYRLIRMSIATAWSFW
jgi:hypothetical protein